MTSITEADLISGLEAAIDGKSLCVQAWLGYADVLFAGLGPSVFPPLPPKADHPIPPYEIHTNQSHWTVYQDFQVVGSSHDDPRAQEASDMLVGRTALSFRFSPDIRNLWIEFTDGIELRIVPYERDEDNPGLSDVWWLRLTDGTHLVVRSDGSIEAHEPDE